MSDALDMVIEPLGRRHMRARPLRDLVLDQEHGHHQRAVEGTSQQRCLTQRAGPLKASGTGRYQMVEGG